MSSHELNWHVSHFMRKPDFLMQMDVSQGSHSTMVNFLTLLHSERPKLYTILAFLSAIGLRKNLLLKSKCEPFYEKTWSKCKWIYFRGSNSIMVNSLWKHLLFRRKYFSWIYLRGSNSTVVNSLWKHLLL